MERLLVFADDSSEGADIAWAWVCAQSWPGWRAEVVTVLPEQENPGGAAHAWEPDRPRSAPDSSGLASIRHMVAYGDPRAVLEEVTADLLVIGPKGAGLRKKLHLGSVAESLLTCPNSPTVIAKGPRAVRNITVAVDGSTHSRAAVQVLGTLPWAQQAHVDIVGVETGDGSATAGVEAAAETLVASGGNVEGTVLRPQEWDLTVNVRSDLSRFVEEHPCDLVAMGTQGLRGLKRLRVGSTADYLSRHVDCPVLLVRDRTPAD